MTPQTCLSTRRNSTDTPQEKPSRNMPHYSNPMSLRQWLPHHEITNSERCQPDSVANVTPHSLLRTPITALTRKEKCEPWIHCCVRRIVVDGALVAAHPRACTGQNLNHQGNHQQGDRGGPPHGRTAGMYLIGQRSATKYANSIITHSRQNIGWEVAF